jgi:RIO-like serine/threonine protein kinase
VLRVTISGEPWAIKTYRNSPWVYRSTLGRFWVRREYRVISTLKDVQGLPRNPRLLDECSFCSRYEEGRTLLDVRKQAASLGEGFFQELENTVREMHRRGFCHLDLRNGRNILVTEGEHPLVLDFQSSIPIHRLPACAQRMLRNIDLSGVYKWWNRLSPETMDGERFELFQKLNRKRILWPFKGYGSWLRVWRAEALRAPGKRGE